jgi:hypothetical protein
MVLGPGCREDGRMCPNGMHHAARTGWYDEGISKLVSRYDKCLNVQGGEVGEGV